jgi:hypothetical protein
VSHTRWTLVGTASTASVDPKEAMCLRLATWLFWRSMSAVNNKGKSDKRAKLLKEAKETEEAKKTAVATEAEEAAPKYNGKGKEKA